MELFSRTHTCGRERKDLVGEDLDIFQRIGVFTPTLLYMITNH
jgi:hypothetical protein